MSELKCGYCREPTHRRPLCPLLHHQRRSILENTVAERKTVYSRACEVGLGNGAIIKFREWNGERMGIITDLESCIPSWHFYNYKKVVYSKKSELYFCSFKDSFTSYHMKALVDNMVLGVRVPFSVFHPQESYPSYLRADFQILSPAHDQYEVSDEVWESKIDIHKRLALAEEVVEARWGTTHMNKKYNKDIPYEPPKQE